MTTQIDLFEEHVRGAEFSSDRERFDWLQEQLSIISLGTVHPADPLLEMLALHSDEAARADKTDRVAGWIAATKALRDTLPDPDEQFYGVLIASEIWGVGLHYGFADMVRFLKRLRSITSHAYDPRNAGESANILYQLLLTRMEEIDMMLRMDLLDGETVLSDWSRNPDVVANAIELSDQLVGAHIERIERNERRAPTIEEIEPVIARGGDYLRACHWAAETGVGIKIMRKFAFRYPNDWSAIIKDLVRESAFVPGVLTAILKTTAPRRRVADSAAELVAAHRAMRPPPCPLEDYLTNCLTAVEQDA